MLLQFGLYLNLPCLFPSWRFVPFSCFVLFRFAVMSLTLVIYNPHLMKSLPEVLRGSNPACFSPQTGAVGPGNAKPISIGVPPRETLCLPTWVFCFLPPGSPEVPQGQGYFYPHISDWGSMPLRWYKFKPQTPLRTGSSYASQR